jgi:hypothetical protein
MEFLSFIWANWHLVLAFVVAVMAVLRVIAEQLTAIGVTMNKPELGAVAKVILTGCFYLGKFIGFFGLGTPSAVIQAAALKLK